MSPHRPTIEELEQELAELEAPGIDWGPDEEITRIDCAPYDRGKSVPAPFRGVAHVLSVLPPGGRVIGLALLLAGLIASWALFGRIS